MIEVVDRGFRRSAFLAASRTAETRTSVNLGTCWGKSLTFVKPSVHIERKMGYPNFMKVVCTMKLDQNAGGDSN